MTDAPRFCEHCGDPLGEGVAFCESCGTPVAEVPPTPATPAVAPPAPAVAPAAAAVAPPAPAAAASRSPRWIPLVIGILGVLIIVASIVSAL